MKCPPRRTWSCLPMARTRTSCASSTQSMSTSARALMTRSGVAARRSMTRSRSLMARPRTNAWVDGGAAVILRLVAVALAWLVAAPALAQRPGLGADAELVDPNVFRVCADPHNLPFSDEQGEGFENKLADLF